MINTFAIKNIINQKIVTARYWAINNGPGPFCNHMGLVKGLTLLVAYKGGFDPNQFRVRDQLQLKLKLQCLARVYLNWYIIGLPVR